MVTVKIFQQLNSNRSNWVYDRLEKKRANSNYNVK